MHCLHTSSVLDLGFRLGAWKGAGRREAGVATTFQAIQWLASYISTARCYPPLLVSAYEVPYKCLKQLDR
jgi:hypothetical protein